MFKITNQWSGTNWLIISVFATATIYFKSFLWRYNTTNNCSKIYWPGITFLSKLYYKKLTQNCNYLYLWERAMTLWFVESNRRLHAWTKQYQLLHAVSVCKPLAVSSEMCISSRVYEKDLLFRLKKTWPKCKPITRLSQLNPRLGSENFSLNWKKWSEVKRLPKTHCQSRKREWTSLSNWCFAQCERSLKAKWTRKAIQMLACVRHCELHDYCKLGWLSLDTGCRLPFCALRSMSSSLIYAANTPGKVIGCRQARIAWFLTKPSHTHAIRREMCL